MPKKNDPYMNIKNLILAATGAGKEGRVSDALDLCQEAQRSVGRTLRNLEHMAATATDVDDRAALHSALLLVRGVDEDVIVLRAEVEQHAMAMSLVHCAVHGVLEA